MRQYHQRIAFYTKQSNPTSFKGLQETLIFKINVHENKHKHSANHNECAEISFFNSPRHSGLNVGNKYVILYTKSRQAGGERERIVREKQRLLFMTS